MTWVARWCGTAGGNRTQNIRLCSQDLVGDSDRRQRCNEELTLDQEQHQRQHQQKHFLCISMAGLAERRDRARRGKCCPTCSGKGNHSSLTYPARFRMQRSGPKYGLDGNEEVRDDDYEDYAKRGKRKTATRRYAGCDGLGKEADGGIAHMCGTVGGNRAQNIRRPLEDVGDPSDRRQECNEEITLVQERDEVKQQYTNHLGQSMCHTSRQRQQHQQQEQQQQEQQQHQTFYIYIYIYILCEGRLGRKKVCCKAGEIFTNM